VIDGAKLDTDVRAPFVYVFAIVGPASVQSASHDGYPSDVTRPRSSYVKVCLKLVTSLETYCGGTPDPHAGVRVRLLHGDVHGEAVELIVPQQRRLEETLRMRFK
jgi:hypothetical protein